MPLTLLRSSNVGLFTFMARVVISYLEIVQSNLKHRALRKTLVQRLVVDANGHVTVLYELMYRKKRVVWLEICWSSYTKPLGVRGMTHFHHRFRNFWRWQDRKRGQHSIWVLLHAKRHWLTWNKRSKRRTSRIFDRSRLPRPAPVPPPREWII